MACLEIQKVSAAGEPGPFGTRLNYGYFKGGLDTNGNDVLIGGIFSNSVEQFIFDVISAFNDVGNNNRHTGASFIINTMLGRNRPGNLNLTNAELADWASRVRSPDLIINFSEGYSYCLNSYWQDSLADDSFYDRPACWRPTDIYNGRLVGTSIVFRSRTTGAVLYAIRRVCGNPVGNPIGLPVANFNMSATMATWVNGVPGTTAEAGDTITFFYTPGNSGPGTANGITCQTNRHDYIGYRPPPVAVDAGSTPGPAMGAACPASFPPGFFPQTSETVTAVANTTQCRFLTVSPRDGAGGSDVDVACVSVHTKPYFKVYGGDASAGTSFAPCAVALPAGQGQIQGFNKGAAGGYAGSGTEVAAFAYRAIDGFVSADMRTTAPQPPAGLTFANNGGGYGGDFGAGRCLPDYWALSTSTGATVHNVGAGNWPIGATSLGAGVKQDVFVDGDALITGDVVYTGSWALDLASNTVPSFRLIVRNGNIYIRDTVTQLDGVYVAIPRADGSKGLIYSCALAAAPPTDAQVAGGCKQQLRVNGAFIAKGVKLLRTPNSLTNAVANETSAVTRAGEIFTYTPEVWMAIPQFTSPTSSSFDAVTSLPPVL